MKCAELNVEIGRFGRGETPRSGDSIRCSSLQHQSGVRMIRLPRRRPTKALTSFLYVLTSFTIVIFLTGSFDSAFASDKPKLTDPKVTDTDQIEIPGSFK